jgi:hypothetical protein
MPFSNRSVARTQFRRRVVLLQDLLAYVTDPHQV